MILVGFSKQDLSDMMKLVGTDREEELIIAPYNMVPRYRLEKSCSEEEVKSFLSYVEFMSKKIEEV